MIENFYCMTLGYVFYVKSVCFVFLVRKDLVGRKDLVDQCSNLILLICLKLLLILIILFFIY